VLWNGGVFFGSGDGNIYALNAASGVLTWKFKTGDVVHASPAIAGGRLFVGSWDSYFYALDAVTGKEKWRFKTGEDPVIHNQVGIQSSAAVVDGVVYFGCRDSNFYALDAATGEKKWRPSATDGITRLGYLWCERFMERCAIIRRTVECSSRHPASQKTQKNSRKSTNTS